ncbi:uncharacterized protein METZ01_LOCUS497394 [marine metagenome]|uniref:Glycosyltransferase 2-like domain-containing protein n=1 Tax=marine metagenome TaxID=408172 RepID=A0A383DJP6_9ZZZZ
MNSGIVSGGQKERSTCPRVTLCLATFEAEAFIEVTLRSICCQTYKNFKCLIFDDASEDGTIGVCETVLEDDVRFEIQVHDERLG